MDGRKRIIWVGLFPREGRCVADHAQIIAIQKHFEQYFSDYEVVKFYRYELEDWNKFVSIVEKDDLIFIQSGGDFGSFHLEWHETRKRIIATFPQNKIVQLPIGVLYQPVVGWQWSFEEDKNFFNVYKNTVIFCRNPISKKVLANNFGCKVLFFMDFVLSLKPTLTNKPRKGALLILRKDNETIIAPRFSDNLLIDKIRFPAPIAKVLRKIGFLKKLYRYPIIASHLLRNSCLLAFLKWQIVAVTSPLVVKEVQMADYPLTSKNREQYVNSVFDFYQNFQVVVTDRFHGMIFSVLTETPCVVLPCKFSHKMRGYQKLVPKSIEFVNSIREVSSAIKRATSQSCKPIDYSRYYEGFRNIVFDALNGVNTDDAFDNRRFNVDPDDLLALVMARRSHRSWLQEPVEDVKIGKIVQAGIYAPTAANHQATRFKVVDDKLVINKICGVVASWFAINPPDKIIIVLYDAGKPHPIGIRASLLERYAWQDTACAMMNMMLMAESLGFKTCWCSVDEKALKQIVGLPKRYIAPCMLFVGYGGRKVDLETQIHQFKPIKRNEKEFIL